MPINRSSLPPNVRRWLDRSLPADAPLPHRILNTQAGEMDIRGKWSPFTAKTLNQIQPFTFVWKARFNMLPGVWLIAEDGHDGERGWGSAKLWGVIPMGGRKTPEVFAMQLVRDLAELPWKPQFALAIPALQWRDTGDTTFEVRAVKGNQDISVRFELDGEDQVIRASGKRYYDVPDGFVKAPWHYDFSDHRDHGGMHIPTSAVATYAKPDGPWTYWRGKITSVVLEP
jgi:hypothetical protein